MSQPSSTTRESDGWFRDEHDVRYFLTDQAMVLGGLAGVLIPGALGLSAWWMLIGLVPLTLGSLALMVRVHNLVDRGDHDSGLSYTAEINRRRAALFASNETLRAAWRELGRSPRPWVLARMVVAGGVVVPLFLAGMIRYG